jgi:hypothetical protein
MRDIMKNFRKAAEESYFLQNLPDKIVARQAKRETPGFPQQRPFASDNVPATRTGGKTLTIRGFNPGRLL